MVDAVSSISTTSHRGRMQQNLKGLKKKQSEILERVGKSIRCHTNLGNQIQSGFDWG